MFPSKFVDYSTYLNVTHDDTFEAKTTCCTSYKNYHSQVEDYEAKTGFGNKIRNEGK